uniref:Cadherin domain-containing protein n=1 Tax=Panagrellus redivivus TaxID=6233 RepID=A0A7E4V7D2_PANRE
MEDRVQAARPTIASIQKSYTKRELTFNREGQLLMNDGGKLEMWRTVMFNEDGTLNITAADLPDPRTIVILKNAEIFVSEKPEKPKKNVIKQKSNASVKVVTVVVVLLLGGVIIGILVCFCVIRRPESKQIDECGDQDDSPRLRSSNLSATMPVKPTSNSTKMTARTSAKVVLKKEQIERVSFDGDELIIIVDNSVGRGGWLQLCFASAPDTSYRLCPTGFIHATLPIRANEKLRLTVNRGGQLPESILRTLQDIKFNEDNTLNITMVQLPDTRTIVVLENAEIFVPEVPKEDKVVTKEKSSASVKVVTVVVVFLLVGVIIGILVCFCVIRRPESKQIDECNDQDDSPTPHRKSATPQKLSTKTPAERASNTTTPTTIQTAVCSKQVAPSYSGINAHSPSMTKSLEVTASKTYLLTANARVPLADNNIVPN